jgi:uncharacterized protein (DUF1800 family)
MARMSHLASDITPGGRSQIATARKRKRLNHARHTVPAGAPTRLHAASVTSAAVLLAWHAPRDAKHLKHYEIRRNGRHLAKTHGSERRFNDTKVRPSSRYRYTVLAVDGRHRDGPVSNQITVRTPSRHSGSHGSGATSGSPIGPLVSGGGPTAPSGPLSTPMVERLFWRAGFGPTDADRQAWTGQSVSDLVEHFLSTPQSYAATSTPPVTQGNGQIDPLVDDDELIMEWLDKMQRATNPFFERLNFFWHCHFAVSRDSGIPAQWLLNYRDLLHGYSDLAANPQASFHALALDMTTNDGAMSYFLSGASNVAGHPNENYAREFMELFCLGVNDAAGNPNYSQSDVQQLARALTGWSLDQQPASPTFGRVSFSPGSFDSGNKTILGQSGHIDAPTAVNIVLSQPSHAPFLITKLWHEFILTPPSQATLDALVATYTSGGALLLKPLLRQILSDPTIFESIGEPNMIKSPLVYTVGVLRAMEAPMKWFWVPEAMTNMQQLPYHPPNVAGWEGGLSWLNSNTVQARFDLLVRLQYLKYGNYPGTSAITDIPGETPQQAVDRAYSSGKSPWLSDQTKSLLLSYASSAPTATAAQRRQRQYALQALMLGGPDAGVM